MLSRTFAGTVMSRPGSRDESDPRLAYTLGVVRNVSRLSWLPRLPERIKSVKKYILFDHDGFW